MIVKLLFCCLYILFTGPLIRALRLEIATCSSPFYIDLEIPPAPQHVALVLTLWIFVLVCVYGLVWAIGERIGVPTCNHKDSKIIMAKPATMKYHRRNAAEHRTNCLFIALFFGVILYPRVIQPFLLNKPFILWFLFFFVVYSALFETCEAMTKLTLTANLATNPLGLAIVVTSACIIGGFLFHHLVCAVGESDDAMWHHSGFWGGLIVQAVVFCFPSYSHNDRVSLHIHHYYWPLPLLQLCVFASSQVSLVTCAMLCAISMHGIAFFGVQPLIYFDSDSNSKQATS
jgi:hypothetical protein